jgi:hypothetical protein
VNRSLASRLGPSHWRCEAPLTKSQGAVFSAASERTDGPSVMCVISVIRHATDGCDADDASRRRRSSSFSPPRPPFGGTSCAWARLVPPRRCPRVELVTLVSVAVAVAVEAVDARAADADGVVGDVGAVEVVRNRGAAGAGTVGVAPILCGRWRRGRRRRGWWRSGLGWRPEGVPDATRLGLGQVLGVPVGHETAEGIIADVDVGEAAGKQLEAEVSPAGKPNVGKQAAVTDVRVLTRVAPERHPPTQRELAHSHQSRIAVALTDLRRLDPDQANECASSAQNRPRTEKRMSRAGVDSK